MPSQPMPSEPMPSEPTDAAIPWTPLVADHQGIEPIWVGAGGGTALAVGADGMLVGALDPVRDATSAVQTVIARSPTGAELWTRTLGSASYGMTIMGIEALSGARAAVHIGFVAETSVQWDGVDWPVRGFDVFVISAHETTTLPGALGGSVSALATDDHDVVVAAGGLLLGIEADALVDRDRRALADLWTVVDPEACSNGSAVARWSAGAPTWLHCIRTGLSAMISNLAVTADGDVVACIDVRHEESFRIGTLDLVPEPPAEPAADRRLVVVRLDGSTGALEWASRLPHSGICAGMVALASGELAVAGGSSSWIGNDRQWRTLAGIEAGISRGLEPNGLVDVSTAGPDHAVRIREIDALQGQPRWSLTLAPDLFGGIIASGGGTVGVVGRFNGRFDAGRAGRLHAQESTSYTMMLGATAP